jgi:hypothetical protein
MNLSELVGFDRLDRIIGLNTTEEVIPPHYGNGTNKGIKNGTNNRYIESRLRRNEIRPRRREDRKEILPRKTDGHIRSRVRRGEGLSRRDRGKSRRNGAQGGASGP